MSHILKMSFMMRNKEIKTGVREEEQECDDKVSGEVSLCILSIHHFDCLIVIAVIKSLLIAKIYLLQTS